MIDNVTEVEISGLLPAVERMAGADYRLISITGLDVGDAFELLYHFDRDLTLAHVRTRVSKGTELPSITRIYFCAFVPENELQDFFGIKVINPVVDYGGHMLLSHEAPAHPLTKEPPREEVAR